MQEHKGGGDRWFRCHACKKRVDVPWGADERYGWWIGSDKRFCSYTCMRTVEKSTEKKYKGDKYLDREYTAHDRRSTAHTHAVTGMNLEHKMTSFRRLAAYLRLREAGVMSKVALYDAGFPSPSAMRGARDRWSHDPEFVRWMEAQDEQDYMPVRA